MKQECGTGGVRCAKSVTDGVTLLDGCVTVMSLELKQSRSMMRPIMDEAGAIDYVAGGMTDVTTYGLIIELDDAISIFFEFSHCHQSLFIYI